MPVTTQPLTADEIRRAKPGPGLKKLFDGGGLYLLILPSGVRGWRFRYRYGGHELLLSFGPYPEISLTNARRQRDAARSLLRLKIDPRHARDMVRTAGVTDAELKRALKTLGGERAKPPIAKRKRPKTIG
jgi:hypothetical protein